MRRNLQSGEKVERKIEENERREKGRREKREKVEREIEENRDEKGRK